MIIKPLQVVLLIILLAAMPLFFLGGPHWTSPMILRELWDFGHIVFFSFLLVLIQQFIVLDKVRAWLLVTLAAFFVGAGIEYIQQFVGRDPGWLDVFHNLIGVWLGLFWGQKSQRLIAIFRALSLVLVLITLWPILQILFLMVDTRERFPVITDFEKFYDVKQLHGNIGRSRDHAATGSYAAKVSLTKEEYSDASIDELLGDWNGYRYLVMRLYNPDTEVLALMLKITDLQHVLGDNAADDRFNYGFALVPGWNELRIPIADIQSAPQQRTMDLAKIRGIDIYSRQLKRPRIFYWDNVHLEK